MQINLKCFLFHKNNFIVTRSSVFVEKTQQNQNRLRLILFFFKLKNNLTHKIRTIQDVNFLVNLSQATHLFVCNYCFLTYNNCEIIFILARLLMNTNMLHQQKTHKFQRILKNFQWIEQNKAALWSCFVTGKNKIRTASLRVLLVLLKKYAF